MRKGKSGIVLFLLFIMFSGCDSEKLNERLNKLFSTPRQPISGAVDIGHEWVEITPPKPLKSVSRIQEVELTMEGVDDSAMLNAPLDDAAVKYKDGRQGRIEAYLFDEQGNSYKLKVVGLFKGVILGRDFLPSQKNEQSNKEPDFPYEKVYTKLKIRSDVPIHCEKIEWTIYKSK